MIPTRNFNFSFYIKSINLTINRLFSFRAVLALFCHQEENRLIGTHTLTRTGNDAHQKACSQGHRPYRTGKRTASERQIHRKKSVRTISTMIG
jgi:hypothetical protein